MDGDEFHRRSSDELDPRTAELQDQSGGGGGGGAKYKLLSPAKLPISRSPGLSIPQGLSPSSFLESPVLLSNMKVRFGFARIGFWFFFLVIVLLSVCLLRKLKKVEEGKGKGEGKEIIVF